MTKDYKESFSNETFYNLFNKKNIDVDEIVSHLKIDSTLVNAKNPLGRPLLFICIDNHRRDLFKVLVEHGADVNQSDIRGETILINSIIKNKYEYTELLVEKGVDVNQANKSGFTPLSIALRSGNLHATQLLLKSNVDVDSLSNTKVLDFAWLVSLGNPELLKLIIRAGIDINFIDSKGNVLLWNLIDKNIGNLEDFLGLCNDKGLPYFNLNIVNNTGDRVIDKVCKDLKTSRKFNQYIKLLRKYGSVEPTIPIQLIGEDEGRVDISNGRLDGYLPNVLNAPKFLNYLYRLFPLSKKQKKETLTNYKKQDFGDWRNNHDGVKTIVNVINELIKKGQIQETRYFINPKEQEYTVIWNFKDVLATIIHAIESCSDSKKTDLHFSLLCCLSDLHKCNLGKLINLLSVAQETLASNLINDHVKGHNFTSSLLSKACSQIKKGLKEEAPKAFIKWFFDNYPHAVGSVQEYKPENMSLYSQKIRGIFTQIFTEKFSSKALLDTNQLNILEGSILLPLIRNLGQVFFNNKALPDFNFGGFKKLFVMGIQAIIRDEILVEALDNHENDLSTFFDTISIYPHYMDLTMVKPYIFKKFYYSNKDLSQTLQILNLTKDNFALSNKVENFIDSLKDSVLQPAEPMETINTLGEAPNLEQ